MINDRYIVEKLLGRGRSEVYLCKDSDSDNSLLALKILYAGASASEIDSFKNEFFTLKKLNHPNIILADEIGTVLSKDTDDQNIPLGSLYLTLEYFSGKDLLSYADVVNESVIREIIKQLCSVLYYLHQSNYIYYDIKPENILVKDINEKPVVKVIDMGFARHKTNQTELTIKGTPEYIAPEILKQEGHDYRADLYSLGILLYRIIYGCFPFKTKDELEIYKAHLHGNFEFPDLEYSKELVETVKKLLSKNPEERFNNSIQVLLALDMPVTERMSNEWLPAKAFSNRKDAINILNTYINDNSSNEVFIVKGTEGTGKTILLEELYSRYETSIYVQSESVKTGISFIKTIIKKIIYNKFLYPAIDKDILEKINNLFSSKPEGFAEELKIIIYNITKDNKFILFLDDFNNYDDFTLEVFKSLIPIFQVNKIKTIISENQDMSDSSGFIFNRREIHLSPFTEAQLVEYLDKNFFDNFPKEELKKIILLYSDLLPGNIKSFIKDMVLFKVLDFSTGSAVINRDIATLSLVQNSHEEIYKLRLSYLNKDEYSLAELLAAFNITLNYETISKLLDITPAKLLELLDVLRQKNIIQQANISANPVFISEGLKNYIYNKITNKKEHHNNLVYLIKKRIVEFNRTEYARHLELSEKYKECLITWRKEIKEAERLSAYSYQRRILQHLMELPLSEKDKLNIKIELYKVLYKLSDYRATYDLLSDSELENVDEATQNELLIIKGSCLIGLDEPELGRNLLNSLLVKINDKRHKYRMLHQIALAEYRLNNFTEASNICLSIVGSNETSHEEKAKSYNLLGMIAVLQGENLEKALEYFNEAKDIFQSIGLIHRIVQSTINIGNIYSIKNDRSNAEKYWSKALELNQSIGNLVIESNLLMNIGINNYKNLNFEDAYGYYLRAIAILSSIGNSEGLGRIQTNLGELYSTICEYQNSIEALEIAANIFMQLQNINEEGESLFLLGQIYFVIGDNSRLNKIIDRFKLNIIEKSSLDTQKHNYQLLQQLYLIQSEMKSESVESLILIKDYYAAHENKAVYFFILKIIVQSFILQERYDEAFSELESSVVEKNINDNLIFLAEKNYLLGKIIAKKNRYSKKSELDFFLTAYDLIKNIHITELTWEILYALSISYKKRGNLTKAKEFGKYAKAVIKYIADMIKDQELKTIYLNKPERQKAIKTLYLLEKET